MDFEFWNNCWARPTQPFHLTAPHHFLTKYFPTYFCHLERVLLPLCGKTQDLNFIAEQGIHAIGVEFNPVAVESFFKDSELTPTVTQESDKTHYQAPGIDLWCADFFDISIDDVGRFERIFDRAALIALPDELRPAYAQHLVKLLKSGGKILLVTMDYVATEMSGPPFRVDIAELERLFPKATIKELDRTSILDSHSRWRELELSYLDEVLYDIHFNEL